MYTVILFPLVYLSVLDQRQCSNLPQCAHVYFKPFRNSIREVVYTSSRKLFKTALRTENTGTLIVA